MCVIIDANFAHCVFTKQPKNQFQPLFDWLFSPTKKGILVYGGKLADELAVCEQTRRMLVKLDQGGRAIKYTDSSINKEIKKIRALSILHSQDEHVIALARVSGARTLCSFDHNLHSDFKNRSLIDNPKGCVYQNQTHCRLLRHNKVCPLKE